MTTDDGATTDATWVVLATGCLSVPKLPEVPGLETFEGDWYHTGAWPHEGVELTGKRVALLGTGSSGIQSLPVIARQAAAVWVLQRTPNFSVPAHNRPLTRDDWETAPDVRAAAMETHTGLVGARSLGATSQLDDDEREAAWEEAWQRGGLLFDLIFEDTIVDPGANELAAEFVRRKIRSTVRDAAVAEALSPRNHPIGTKRLCVDSGYFEAFNLPHVRLVDLRATPLVEVTPRGIRTSAGEIEVDVIVCATGYDAMTGAIARIDIVGEAGHCLRDQWAEGPTTYLGLAVAGFPNLWLVTGPGSPSVLTNMLVSIEQHVEWITDCIRAVRDGGARSIGARPEAQAAWTAHVDEVAQLTLFPRANSWYMGANVPGKARRFMPYLGGVPAYRERCEAVAAAGYEGFELGR
ncbi:MAG: flavin-containing monooxygenase [Acidimicrobiales bacterium]